MCGIVAVLCRPSGRPIPALAEVVTDLDETLDVLGAEVSRLSRVKAGAGSTGSAKAADLSWLRQASQRLAKVDGLLRGSAGLGCLLSTPEALIQVAERTESISKRAEELESALEGVLGSLDVAQVEEVNAAVVALKDAVWALSHDRIETARGVAALRSAHTQKQHKASTQKDSNHKDNAHKDNRAEFDAWWSIEVALRAIDRLEVRGRDSAGLHLLVSGHGLDLETDIETATHGEIVERRGDQLFASKAVRTPSGCLSLVYKAAAEIGELGDNVKALREAIRSDDLLKKALQSPNVAVTVVGHTRWASVGAISEANAHPLNSEEEHGRPGHSGQQHDERKHTGHNDPYVVVVANGDVDNHTDLRTSEALRLPAEITSDTKVLPTLVARKMAQGDDATRAFGAVTARVHGSVAVAASTADSPDQLDLALKGSGQGLFVGLAEDAFVVASEVYGVVEESSDYIRMEGELPGGQIITLRREKAGTLAGVSSINGNGTKIPLGSDDVRHAEITTRDIDRRHFPHFLLKEISEAPQSFKKTLRGKIVGDDSDPHVRLGDDTLPETLRRALAGGSIQRVLVIGQGTAAVAGQGVAAAISRCLPAMQVVATPATELSGFGLIDDMSDALVIAISQSGSTTDTNRTVDLVRARGAHVVSVVNRRNSDLAEKSHGVLYTSDGRDVEMSVASTKAFYAQIAAGWLLALGLSAAAGASEEKRDRRLLAALRRLPDAMEETLAHRSHVGAVAAAEAPRRRYWAIVGSGPDRVAAAETRIKLSELCYKAIACDATEDKKHIDLSSEPLILVCATGLSGANADDVAKEVAIYKAHQAAPIVVAGHSAASRFRDASAVIEVPDFDPELSFVLAAMVGHLFGYEAALAIDAQARPLRAARSIVEGVVGQSLELDTAAAPSGSADGGLDRIGPSLAAAVRPWITAMRRGDCDGHLEAGTAVRIMSLLRYATGAAPLDGYEFEFGTVARPSAVMGDLLGALSAGVDQLTRPVDAIKHQAKTVTVGISRSEDELVGVGLVKEALNAGATMDRLGYRAMRTLAALDPAVEEVLGYTRYRIEGYGQAGGLAGAVGLAGAGAGALAGAVSGRGASESGGGESAKAGSDPEANPGRLTVIDQAGIALELPPSRTTTDPRLRGSKHRAVDEREVMVVQGRGDGRTVIVVPETQAGHPVGITLLHVAFFDRLAPDQARAVLTGYRGRYQAIVDAVTETEPAFNDELLSEVDLVELLTRPVYSIAEHWRQS